MSVAFIFPGQGTQYVGMGKEIYEQSSEAKEYFDNVFSVLDFDLKTAMFEGPEEVLKQTEYTQPAIVAYSLFLAKKVMQKGITPDYVAGHSLGEYTALGVAGFIGEEDTVKLTAKRGLIMSEVTEEVKGTMAAIVGLESQKIEEICNSIEGVAEAVNYNEPKQTVIAGTVEGIEKAGEALKKAGAPKEFTNGYITAMNIIGENTVMIKKYTTG